MKDSINTELEKISRDISTSGKRITFIGFSRTMKKLNHVLRQLLKCCSH